MELLRPNDSTYKPLNFTHYDYYNSSGPLLFEEHLSIGVYLIATGLFFGTCQVIGLITYLNFPTVLWKASVLPEVILMVTDLAISGLHPFSGVSAILNRWIWGPYGCQAYAFAGMLLGVFQLLLVPFIALVRCIEAGTKGTKRRTKCYWITLIILFLFAFCWALAPIFGISRYNQTPVQITCTIDWLQNDFIYMIYIYSEIGAVAGLPFLIGLTCVIVLFVKVTKESIRLEWAPEGKEGRVMVGRLLGVYLAYIAFGVVSVWAIISEDPKHELPLWLYILPPTLAKLAGFFNLIFYFWLNPKLLACLRKLLGCSYDRSLVYDLTDVSGYQAATSTNAYKPSAGDGTKEEARNLTTGQKVDMRGAGDPSRHHAHHEEVDYADE